MLSSMKVLALFALAASAYVSADAPPIPYAAASGVQPSSYASDRTIQTEHYVDHFSPEYNVQPAYEGYVVPAAEHGFFPFVEGLDLKSHGLVSKIFKNLVSLGSKVVPKVALGAVVILGLFLVGSCVNALICTLTPFCTISFHGFGVTKESMRSYLTPDRITTTATFVMDAIKKYKDMYESVNNEIDVGKKSK